METTHNFKHMLENINLEYQKYYKFKQQVKNIIGQTCVPCSSYLMNKKIVEEIEELLVRDDNKQTTNIPF